MSYTRFDAVEEAFARPPVNAVPPAPATSEYYGCYVFNRKTMRKYLSSDTRQKVYESIEQGVTLNRDVAEQVAAGMKRWAMDMGATHYTHWFQPLTGGTAEKHDSFAEPYGKGESLEEFTGKLLCQQEPDASSFPSGGLRNTFEARGYTAWDPSSPAFVMDYKAPLLKSEAAIAKATADILKYFGIENEFIYSYLGWEQEYFLVDASLYAMRPDIIMAERTLVGHNSARNQQLEDHYFGCIPSRVLEFMKDLEFECYKLGIPIKTRHNEVAPNQFEIAPVYEQANLAIDHNLELMAVMKTVAEKHGFKVLFHEKPFEGINGSGKHCNWSIGTADIGLLSPGKTEMENLRFLTFTANILKAVYDNNALLKASVMTASNSHRLGANEAPPAIISSFLGTQVSQAFEELLNSDDMVRIGGKSKYSLGIPQIPELLIDNTDRNRTSPFAFTGNRFEFRAVGSSANCSSAVTVLNTIVAAQLVKFKEAVDRRIANGESQVKAIMNETREVYRSCRDVCFDGNGYSDEWKEEAKRRGLDCETSAPLCYDAFLSEKTIETYSSVGVMNEVELRARTEINWEIYSKKIEIEARVLADLTANHILPVSTRYQSILLDNVSKMKEIFTDKKDFDQVAAGEIQIIKDIAMHTSEARALSVAMEEECDRFNALDCQREKAIKFHDVIVPYLESIRKHVDALEMIVDDDMWPLPKYRELLFIR